MIACEVGPRSASEGNILANSSLGTTRPNCTLMYCVLQSQCTEGPSRPQVARRPGSQYARQADRDSLSSRIYSQMQGLAS